MASINIATPSHPPIAHGHGTKGGLGLAFGALGVVFGDIGTSPLYTLKECMHAAGGERATPIDVYGIVSLILWALFLVVTIKYLIFILRADHGGEGGIFALLALVPERFRRDSIQKGRVTGVALVGVIGAALLYGDGVITPAISVLSAVEGLTVANESLRPIVLPLTCAILIGLFAIQHRGTGQVGRLFGPVMLVWFATLAVLGVWHIGEHPQILRALSPHYAVEFFAHHGLHGFLILGSVVLAVTGGEALYADMGHFGRGPIRMAWTGLVFPSLMLCYLGQGAMLLGNPKTAENPFFSQVPAGPATLALVVLSSLATVIASQALISGAFSLTRQAMVLGYFPRVTIRHTSKSTEGQIYIPEVNWLLAIGCLFLVIAFGQSVRLAAAYGIAVTGTMAITSLLFFIVTRYLWNWPLWKASGLLAFFLAIDLPFLVANLFKFFDGGYIPMLIGAALIAGMLIWFRGRTFLEAQYESRYPRFDQAHSAIMKCVAARVPGNAVFIAPSEDHVPPILVHMVERCRSLAETVVLLTVKTEIRPVVPENERYQITGLEGGFWRVIIHFGYMELPHVVPVLGQITGKGELPIKLEETTYYVGHETLLATDAGNMGRLAERLFSYLQRNAVSLERTYALPHQKVVELGARIDL